jgi:hypothetical protein
MTVKDKFDVPPTLVFLVKALVGLKEAGSMIADGKGKFVFVPSTDTEKFCLMHQMLELNTCLKV